MRFHPNFLLRMRVFLALILFVGFTDATFAHDPGLSSVIVTVKGEQMDAVATFARKDVENLAMAIGVAREGEAVTERQLEQLAPKIVSAESDGQLVQPSETHARFADQNNVEFSLTFPIGAADKIKIGSPLIESLPMGHRQFLSVSDDAGRKLTERLLRTGASTARLSERRRRCRPRRPFSVFWRSAWSIF
jgi:hypothetical protein